MVFNSFYPNLRPKWVFFDLDDTLWDFSGNSYIALERLYSSYAILHRVFDSFSKFDDAYHSLNARLWDLYHHGRIEKDYLLTQRFRGLFPEDAISDKECRRLNSAYLEFLCQGTLLIDGAVEVSKRYAKDYLIGVVSNGFRHTQYRKLYGCELWRYVQRMVISDEIGIQKPDPRFFDYALQATGATSDELLFIGDNLDADVMGALAAGWPTIYFDRHSAGNAPSNIPTIRSLRELL